MSCHDWSVSSAPPTAHVPEISREELIRALRAGHITLVDVLSPESFAVSHLPNAINVPVADLARLASDLLPDRHAAIVAYCGGPT